jgi:hypothetical protein
MPGVCEAELFKSVFGARTFREVFNRKAALYLRDHVLPTDGATADASDASDDHWLVLPSARQAVEQLLRAAQGESYINVHYEKGARSAGGGRWFAKGEATIQRMPRRVRHTLCAGLWIDLDFSNCHPVLLQQICVKEGVHCPSLDRYISEREEMLAEVVSAAGCSRDEAKKSILKVLNGGSVTDIHVDWWAPMCHEFKNIAQQLANLERNKKAMALVKQRGKHNVNARVMNVMLCVEENECLQALFQFLHQQKCVPDGECVLIFDGLQIRDLAHTRALLDSGGLLQKASKFIEDSTGWCISVTEKAFDEAYPLPPPEVVVEDTVCIEKGDDQHAAEEFLQRFRHRLAQCSGRHFWLEDGVYTDNTKAVHNGVASCLSQMDIQVKSKFGLMPYSRNVRHADDCTRAILRHPSINDETFIDRLWSTNLRYLAFKDSVYSFRDKSLVSAEGVYFTIRIPRDFPSTQREDTERNLMKDVLETIFPNPEQLQYFLHCVSRALAGELYDKKWYVLIGERNSGKGVLGWLLERAFGGFVQTINADNLMCTRMGNGDTAKKQSWMSDLEFKRIAFSNEVCGELDKVKVDGNMVKRMASGGDTVEVRTNYKDETRKKLQSTMFLCCNEFPKVEPADAYETLEVFNFPSKFVSEAEYHEACDNRPKHWRLANPKIKEELASDEVTDAFTAIVLRAYEPMRRAPPPCVVQDTANFKGVSTGDVSERIREVVHYSENSHHMVFTEQIKMVLEQSGIGALSSFKVEEYIRRLYGHFDPPPVHKRYTINDKRGWGFSHIKVLRLEVFDGRTERMNQAVQEREMARQTVKRRLDERDTTEYHKDFLCDTSEEFRVKDANTYSAWLVHKRSRQE